MEDFKVGKTEEEIANEMALTVCPRWGSELCVSGACPSLWECPLSYPTCEVLSKAGYRKVEE